MTIVLIWISGLATGMFFKDFFELIGDIFGKKKREQMQRAENNRKTMDFATRFKII